MENKRLGQKLKEYRLRNGFTQEILAEKAELNLRSVQRIEKGLVIPRGDTLTRLCDALQINLEDLIDLKKENDVGYLSLMNLSAISFILNPLLGIIIPLVLWVSKKDKIERVDEFGKEILNFQITLLILLSSIILTVGLVFLILKSIITLGLIDWFGPFLIFYIPVGLYYLYNSIMIISNLRRIQNDQSLRYSPRFNIIT
jgi:uncharacterized Tic20 family protein